MRLFTESRRAEIIAPFLSGVIASACPRIPPVQDFTEFQDLVLRQWQTYSLSRSRLLEVGPRDEKSCRIEKLDPSAIMTSGRLALVRSLCRARIRFSRGAVIRNWRGISHPAPTPIWMRPDWPTLANRLEFCCHGHFALAGLANSFRIRSRFPTALGAIGPRGLGFRAVRSLGFRDVRSLGFGAGNFALRLHPYE